MKREKLSVHGRFFTLLHFLLLLSGVSMATDLWPQPSLSSNTQQEHVQLLIWTPKEPYATISTTGSIYCHDTQDFEFKIPNDFNLDYLEFRYSFTKFYPGNTDKIDIDVFVKFGSLANSTNFDGKVGNVNTPLEIRPINDENVRNSTVYFQVVGKGMCKDQLLNYYQVFIKIYQKETVTWWMVLLIVLGGIIGLFIVSALFVFIQQKYRKWKQNTYVTVI